MSAFSPNSSCRTTTPGHGGSPAGTARYAPTSPAAVESVVSGIAPEGALAVAGEGRARDGDRHGEHDDREDDCDADAHARTLSARRVVAPGFVAQKAAPLDRGERGTCDEHHHAVDAGDDRSARAERLPGERCGDREVAQAEAERRREVVRPALHERGDRPRGGEERGPRED